SYTIVELGEGTVLKNIPANQVRYSITPHVDNGFIHSINATTGRLHVRPSQRVDQKFTLTATYNETNATAESVTVSKDIVLKTTSKIDFEAAETLEFVVNTNAGYT